MMNTKIERVNPEQIDETIMEEAGRLIAEGELVAFPTETVYGLGGDPRWSYQPRCALRHISGQPRSGRWPGAFRPVLSHS